MFGKVRRFLGRLFSHKRGNTYAIVAAALIPITAMIGSGLDISRAYMAKNRLQNACDAGSLAARRVMRNDELTDNVVAVGRQFFNFNFPQNSYQTANFEPEVTRPSVGLIRITAATRIPTSIMYMFGFDSLPLSVDCEASLNFVNTDVVLVLDVTGSMADPIDGTTRIVALREAVMALYDELRPVQTQLESQGLRLRYGIVPYSSTVNVGRLIAAVDPNYIRNETPYQSRVANYTSGPTYLSNSSTSSNGWEIYNGTRTTSQCSTWVRSSSVNGGGPAPTATTVTSYRGSSSNANYVESTNWGWSGASVTSGTSKSCRRWRTVTTTTYDPTPRYTFSGWTYQQATLDTSALKLPGGTINLATDTGGVSTTSRSYNLQELAGAGIGASATSVSWNGCIEERDTVTGTIGLSIPANAFDLNINRIPDNEQTRWRPMLANAVFSSVAWCAETDSRGRCIRNTNQVSEVVESRGYHACPVEARRLTEWERGDLNTYINTLQPVGGTYHDIGMLWGARFISTSGIFADGCETYNGMPCNRHVIFMTDGAQTAYCTVYTAYGFERLDRRVLGSNNCTSDNQTDNTTANLLARHQERFRSLCNATKNQNASVWVIAFDMALTNDLTSCASNSSQASTSTSRDDLIARFRQIGNQIGALRLTK